MRPLASALVILAASCTSSAPEGPASTQNPLTVGAGLEAGTVLETARAFIEAYRDPRTVAARHRALIAGQDLQDWARWAGLQNAGLDFLRRGRVEIRFLRFAGIEGPFASVDVDARIELRRREDGDILESDRRFTSPMVLGNVEGAGWRVVDVVRDDRPMVAAIVVLDPPLEIDKGSARIEVASVFRFSAGTVVNLRIENRGGAPVRVDVERSLLSVRGEEVAGEQTTTSLLRPIAPGATAAGGLTFPPIPIDGIPETVSVRLRGDSRPLDAVTELPEEPFVLEPQPESNNPGAGP